MKLTMDKVLSLEPVQSVERRHKWPGDRHPQYILILKKGWQVPHYPVPMTWFARDKLKDCMALALRAVKRG